MESAGNGTVPATDESGDNVQAALAGNIVEDITEHVFIKKEPEEMYDEAEEEEAAVNDDFLSNEPENVTVKTEPDGNCPPSLIHCSEEEIMSAFRDCYKKKTAKSKSAKSKSTPFPFLGKVFETLTQLATTPTLDEQEYLNHLWLFKYKDLLGANKVRKKRTTKSCLYQSRKNSKYKKLNQQAKLAENLSKRTAQPALLEPNDIIVKAEPGANCPPSLQKFTETDMHNAFHLCFVKTRKLILNHTMPKSLFGKVAIFLTEEKTSTVIERRYLWTLWSQKYKYLLGDTRRDEILKCSKEKRSKCRRRILQQEQAEQARLLQSVECVYNENISKVEGNTCAVSDSKSVELPSSSNMPTLSPLEDDVPCNFNRLIDSAPTLSPAVTPPVESDYSNAESDQDAVPSPAPSVENERPIYNDPKLKQKIIIKVARLGPKELRKRNSSIRKKTTRRKVPRKKYDDIATFSCSDRDEQDHADNEEVDAVNECSENDVHISVGPPNRYNTIGKLGEDCICSVCGRPLSKNVMTFHMRTHFSYEEQKQYLIERKQKYKEMSRQTKLRNGSSVSKKISTESRLDQLKRLLEGREKIIEKKTQDKKVIPRVSYYVPNKGYTKRDGNYGPVQCAQCGKVVATIYVLKSHELTQHSNGQGKKLPCNVCGRPFASKSVLRCHITTHFNSEEIKLYATWMGSIEEFMQRLNTGEDLSKPPTRRKGWGQYRRSGAPPRPLLFKKKKGRPRKHNHLYEKNAQNSSNAATTVPPQTSTFSGGMSNAFAKSNTDSYSNTTSELGGQFNLGGHVPSTSGTTVDTGALDWNLYSNQAMGNYFAQNN